MALRHIRIAVNNAVFSLPYQMTSCDLLAPERGYDRISDADRGLAAAAL